MLTTRISSSCDSTSDPPLLIDHAASLPLAAYSENEEDVPGDAIPALHSPHLATGPVAPGKTPQHASHASHDGPLAPETPEHPTWACVRCPQEGIRSPADATPAGPLAAGTLGNPASAADTVGFHPEAQGDPADVALPLMEHHVYTASLKAADDLQPLLGARVRVDVEARCQATGGEGDVVVACQREHTALSSPWEAASGETGRVGGNPGMRSETDHVYRMANPMDTSTGDPGLEDAAGTGEEVPLRVGEDSAEDPQAAHSISKGDPVWEEPGGSCCRSQHGLGDAITCCTKMPGEETKPVFADAVAI
jgi:hypothetical protein